MTAPAVPAPSPVDRTRWIQVGGVLALAGLAAWMVFSAYQPPVVQACRAAYTAAPTAEARQAVDGLVPDVAGNRGPDRRSCGSYRRAARWQLPPLD